LHYIRFATHSFPLINNTYRGKTIVLTKRGWLVVKAKGEILAEIEQRLSEKIGAERIQMIREDLTKIVDEAREDKFISGVRPVW